MKQKFKVGDYYNVVSFNPASETFIKEMGVKFPQKCLFTDGVLMVKDRDGVCRYDKNHFIVKPYKPKPKTLTIKKLTRKRGEKEYHTWQFKVKGKVSNHNFNSPQSRNKSLTRFIKYIQEGDFKIVKG